LVGTKISSHFTPISKDLRLKNTGTLDMASTFLDVTATGCDGSNGAPLAKALHVRLTDETNDDVVYDGTLCSLVRSVHEQSSSLKSGPAANVTSGPAAKDTSRRVVKVKGAHITSTKKSQGFTTRPSHSDVGGQLPHTLLAGESIRYRLVIQPDDPKEGLPSEAQYTHTSVKLVFTGFDY
jgi:hypothetical protein